MASTDPAPGGSSPDERPDPQQPPSNPDGDSSRGTRKSKRTGGKSGKSARSARTARRSAAKAEPADAARAWAREWIDAFVFAAVVAILLRTFIFGSYRIPTPSMEDTLMTGDFLMVSKLSYGPRTPMTLSIPFTQVHVPGVNLPWTRLPGFSEVERHDIIVFNYPVEVGPISARTHYIKTAVGIPGDTLELRDKFLYINGEPERERPTYRRHHVVQARSRIRLSEAKVREAGGEIVQTDGQGLYIVNLTRAAADRMAAWPEVDSLRPFVLPPDFNEFGRRPFMFSQGFENHDHMPPVVVPFSGQEIRLSEETWPVYRDVVMRHEGNDVTIEDGVFFVNGEPADTYTVRGDYYFAMGDNRDDSEDSRFWGFVPESHIVGKAWVVYFSWDRERSLPRFSRFFKRIHEE